MRSRSARSRRVWPSPPDGWQDRACLHSRRSRGGARQSRPSRDRTGRPGDLLRLALGILAASQRVRDRHEEQDHAGQQPEHLARASPAALSQGSVSPGPSIPPAVEATAQSPVMTTIVRRAFRVRSPLTTGSSPGSGVDRSHQPLRPTAAIPRCSRDTITWPHANVPGTATAIAIGEATHQSIVPMYTLISTSTAPRNRRVTWLGCEVARKFPSSVSRTGAPHSGQMPPISRPRRLYPHRRHGRSCRTSSTGGAPHSGHSRVGSWRSARHSEHCFASRTGSMRANCTRRHHECQAPPGRSWAILGDPGRSCRLRSVPRVAHAAGAGVVCVPHSFASPHGAGRGRCRRRVGLTAEGSIARGLCPPSRRALIQIIWSPYYLPPWRDGPRQHRQSSRPRAGASSRGSRRWRWSSATRSGPRPAGAG